MHTLLVAEPIRSVVAMDALTQLAQEHADFIEKLTELEAVLDEMMGTRLASDEDVELLDEAVRFFEEEMFPHFEREEKFLLPPLEARVGRYGSLVNVVEYEHAEVRREVGKIKEGIAALKAKRGGPHVREIEELNRHGIFTVQFLWDHFRKEKMSLFKTAREELTPGELEALASSLTSSPSAREPAPR
ncbi:MAG: hemerythrin domain-containing protein [Methanobacteriota archaeon]|nr:MAG: hemerythrin domain-containing protein [Euryarchaeota archaeon]